MTAASRPIRHKRSRRPYSPWRWQPPRADSVRGAEPGSSLRHRERGDGRCAESTHRTLLAVALPRREAPLDAIRPLYAELAWNSPVAPLGWPSRPSPAASSVSCADGGTLANWAIWLVFLAELVAMLRVVDNRRQWLRRGPLDIAVVVLTPPFFPVSLQSAVPHPANHDGYADQPAGICLRNDVAVPDGCDCRDSPPDTRPMYSASASSRPPRNLRRSRPLF